MTKMELLRIIKGWGLRPSEAAYVLGIEKELLNEYLNGLREIPIFVANTVEAHNALAAEVRHAMFTQRLSR